MHSLLQKDNEGVLSLGKSAQSSEDTLDLLTAFGFIGPSFSSLFFSPSSPAPLFVDSPPGQWSSTFGFLDGLCQCRYWHLRPKLPVQ